VRYPKVKEEGGNIMEQNNCDGSGPHKYGEVRLLPTGGDSNLILCRYCYGREIAFRKERNKELCKENQFALPKWDDLEIYPA